MIWDEIALEIAIIERLAHETVRQRIASQQLGEAWVGLEQVGEVGLKLEVAYHGSGRR